MNSNDRKRPYHPNDTKDKDEQDSNKHDEEQDETKKSKPTNGSSTSSSSSSTDNQADQQQLQGQHEPPPLPPYGSEDYWECRYQRFFYKQQQQRQNQATTTNKTIGTVIPAIHVKNNNNPMEEENPEEEPDPFHAWYFNYEELAPILLPLIFGEVNRNKQAEDAVVDDDDDDDDNDGEKAKQQNKKQRQQKEDVMNNSIDIEQPSNKPSSTMNTLTKEGRQDDDDYEEVNSDTEDVNEELQSNVDQSDDDDDDDDSTDVPPQIRNGLASKGSISVLEIGCGDVPLGRDLVLGLETELSKGLILDDGTSNQDTTIGEKSSSKTDSNHGEIDAVIKKVVCLDYSKTVIDILQQEQEASQQQQQNQTNPPESTDKKTSTDSSSTTASRIINPMSLLEYVVADARTLPYEDQMFELILEKGTLDAMLSDNQVGIQNCQKIVAECARVLTIGGCILLVSHLNAHVPKGLQWLEDVVVAGLEDSTSSDATNKGASLKSTDTQWEWLIEVHGSGLDSDKTEKDEKDDDDDNDNNDQDSMASPTLSEDPGPAVYVIHKLPKGMIEDNVGATKPTSKENDTKNKRSNNSPINPQEDETTSSNTRVQVRFFSY